MPLIDSLTSAVRRVLGTTNDAVLVKLKPRVRAVTAFEEAMRAADDSALRARSAALREQVKAAADVDAGLEAVLPEALALAREVADRRLGMWNAIDPKNGFGEEHWGAALTAVTEARAKLAAGTPAWEIDLPASVYAAIRARHPDSKPPFRMRAHDVQILGAIVLHQGRIAEMKTGEGKTLVASLTCYLNALAQRGVHVVTVNDYLAKRDATWNEPTLRFLGISVGAIQAEMSPFARKTIYAMDVVYGTNNQFGFDYLRDNLAKSLDEQVQTRREFAIVDEVDSILIDEARTPLIISGPAMKRTEFYLQANEVAKGLAKDVDFEIDIKDRHITLTEAGIDKAAKLFGVKNLYDADAMHLPHFLDNALKAHHLFIVDKDYLVSGKDVKIVDVHTGRTLEGRRWSDGLHQAIEAKEGVTIQDESQTYATITLQNLFRLYRKLAGMTGTAMTEANEFNAIYKLEVVAIPPNRVVARVDHPDLIFGSEQEKFDGIIKEIAELHAVGQPVLVGTISVEVSERLSEQFTRKGIPHSVLNARQHAREAEIVAKAGHFGSVTIATNMAGRGTDIVLGREKASEAFKHWIAQDLLPKRMKPDSPELDEAAIDMWGKRFLGEAEAEKITGKTLDEKLAAINARRLQDGLPPLTKPSAFRDGVDVRALGGLRIVGTERHESRRIDNQLRGRSGRQGDPGSSRFYLSLDDDLMKRFAGPTMAGLMRSMGLKDGIPIESGMVTRAVEKAQKRVEEYHYGIRKNLLEYDQVMNTQRSIIYGRRQQLLEGDKLVEFLLDLFGKDLDEMVQRTAADGTRGAELAQRISAEFAKQTGLPAPAPAEIPVSSGGDACRDHLMTIVKAGVEERQKAQAEAFPFVLRFVLLDTIDRRWKDHLYGMDHLRHSIGLESYAQKDPKMRYKEEGFRLFQRMHEQIHAEVARIFFRIEVKPAPAEPERGGPAAALAAGGFAAAGGATAVAPPPPAPAQAKREAPAPLRPPGDHPLKPAPNDPCPCGSGSAYKTCHGV
ncbi:MAG TPA: preprotein translocase subunit SecA [Planctomycetota bacterium]|nr:preprotein translocase subunit SecA [Planctomycetota bacterium]